jgi:hypothetical protein
MNKFNEYDLSGQKYTTDINQFWNDLLGIGISSARVQNQMNRNFQERMANTQWQRGVEDMKKAGINPLSAFTSVAGVVPVGSSGAGGQGSNVVAGIASNIIGTSARLLTDLSKAKSVNMRTDLYEQNLKNLIVTSAKMIK